MATATDAIVSQLETVIAGANELRQGSQYDDASDRPDELLMQARLRLAGAIERFAPPGSEYMEAVSRTNEYYGASHALAMIELSGVAAALRDDYAAGYLTTVQELVHGELFEDFLEMAEELLNKGYVSAAAVLAGSVLEEHVRKLAGKVGIALRNAKGGPVSADTLAVELVKKAAITESERKILVGWYGQRTDAAHGRPEKLIDTEVQKLPASIREFMARHPA
jgi:hypothetical protein